MAEQKPKRRGPSTVAPEAEPSVTRGYDSAQGPEPQGDGDPRPAQADGNAAPEADDSAGRERPKPAR